METAIFNYLRYSKSLKWSRFLLSKSVPISDFRYDRGSDKVFIRSVNHSFSYGEFPVFFNGYNTYCEKFINNGFQFLFRENQFLLKIKELIFNIETLEELFIINEVFVDEVYSIESKSDYIVCDIGMNVGITSLYLSQFENIKYIYGFEPLRPTFESAEANLSLNKRFNRKITAYNFGLGNADKKIRINYDPQNKGNVGIKNLGRSVENALHVEEIELREASKSLKHITSAHPLCKFIIKMDCEGSEYDIVESLVNASMLREFNIFMIEWHRMEGYKNRINNLINCLKESNFLVLGPGDLDKVAGMIYCFANN